MIKHNKTLLVLLIILIIIINCFLAFLPHFYNPYPILADEYVHISLAKQIVDEGKLPFKNPYTITEDKHLNFESGFHFLLAAIFLIFPGEPVLYYKYFVIIFMIINSLLIFYLANLYFKNYYSALFSMLLFGTIKSTGYFMAHWYFIPLTLGTTIILLSFIFFYKWENSKYNTNRYLIFLLITMLIALFSYPPSLTFFLGVVFIYAISIDHDMHTKFSNSKRKFFVYFIIINIIFVLVALLVLHFLGWWKFLTFDQSWSAIQKNLSPLFFFGVPSSLLALLGLLFITFNQYSEKSKRGKILFSWFLFSILEIYLFYIFGFTILVPFKRLFYFYLIGLSLLGGFGALLLSEFISIKIASSLKIRECVKIFIFLLLVSLVFAIYFLVNFETNPPAILLDDNTYNALQFIKENYPKNTIIASDSLTSITVYPVTGMKVLGILGSNIGGGDPMAVNRYLEMDCNGMKIVRDRYNLHLKKIHLFNRNTLLLSKKKINCEDLYKEVYNKGVYVYD